MSKEQMAEIDKAFHNVAIAERNLAWYHIKELRDHLALIAYEDRYPMWEKQAQKLIDKHRDL